MKKVFRFALLFAAASMITAGFSACSDDDDDNNNGSSTTGITAGDKYLQSVLSADVDNTINPTYKLLADSCEILYNQISGLQAKAVAGTTIEQSEIDETCETFLHARANYERSEAFLLGAAAHFNIDPHIDSWPLSLQNLKEYMLHNLSVSITDQSMLGFHGIEFILFRDGQNRSASELNGHDTWNRNNVDFTQFTGAQELTYAKTVAEDLRNSVYRLEISWNEDANAEHKQVLDDLGLTYETDKGNSYGDNLKNAGDPSKSTYSTIKSAVASILTGDNSMGGIADEVGNTKIANPYSGADESYIESPYSWNTLTDFKNNIHSIENMWYGGVQGNRSQNSFHAYFQQYSPAVGQRVENDIVNAIAAINKIPYPFVNNFKASECKAAIDACSELRDALSAANTYIQDNNN